MEEERSLESFQRAFGKYTYQYRREAPLPIGKLSNETLQNIILYSYPPGVVSPPFEAWELKPDDEYVDLVYTNQTDLEPTIVKIINDTFSVYGRAGWDKYPIFLLMTGIILPQAFDLLSLQDLIKFARSWGYLEKDWNRSKMERFILNEQRKIFENVGSNSDADLYDLKKYLQYHQLL
jgi:hypothetical protein